MTTLNKSTLLYFCFKPIAKIVCMGLLMVGLSAASFAAKTSTIHKTKAASATAKLVKKSVEKPTHQSVAVDLGPGAIEGKFVRRANFKQEAASDEARQMADWIVDSHDNKNYPFVILDKKEAKVYVFHPHGGLRGAAPVLLGITVGDDSFPGVGSKPLRDVKPEEKTTPAGRYLAAADKNIKGADIVWIDYDSSVSFHAVVKGSPAERRAERLASPLPSERRISFGCVNVPVNFFKTALHASFKKSDGMVYVLPEARAMQDVFTAFYDVSEKERRETAAQNEMTRF